ncbi:MAG: hypothetical protein ABIN96_01315 [Rubrivivax sp.]
MHRRRLLQIWRSAGWPCCDAIEIDLLAAGLLLRCHDDQGRETLRVTDAGVQQLAAARRRNQAAFDPHEALVSLVARQMQQAGRVVWRGLRLRAPLDTAAVATSESAVPPAALHLSLPLHDERPGPAIAPAASRARWVTAMPDVFSIRHTTVEDYTEPVAHEIKVRRADLLSDLRRPDKGAAYRALASQCWYVLARGIADPDEVPLAYGVMEADARRLQVLRPAPRRALRLSFAVWMALARAPAVPALDADAGWQADGDQRWLGDTGVDAPGSGPVQ